MFKVGKKPDQPTNTPTSAAAPASNVPNQTPPPVANNTSPENNHQPLQSTMYAPSNTRALTDSESLARDIKEGTLNGFVGTGTQLNGDVTFKGMLRIDGHVTGHITSEGGTLIVSNGGQLDASVDVAIATINGTVNGDIVAGKKIELGRAAKVSGNLQTPSLVIEQGAIFEGTCRMQHLKETQARQREQDARAAVAAKHSAPAPSSASPETAIASTASQTPKPSS